jgi:hypothetical protein
MKSTEIDSQGEYDNSRGCNNPNLACRGDFMH